MKTDCIWLDKDNKCHLPNAVIQECNGGCLLYQSKDMCGVCKHFSECNADITGKVCEKYEVVQ